MTITEIKSSERYYFSISLPIAYRLQGLAAALFCSQKDIESQRQTQIVCSLGTD